MKKLGNRKKFEHTENDLRESENFTFTLFKELNFKEIERSISFHRSDFRGARFEDVHFYKNDFNRADFISCTFSSCKFEACNIGASEIKNCYFKNVDFSKNEYERTSIHECIFENCKFPNEQFIVNMKECTFINCDIYNCNFERSVTEKLLFKKCKIINTNFATMHAERHRFESCVLNEVSMGISYFFGYLFSKTELSGVEFLYRGKIVDLNTSKVLMEYLNELMINERYSEYLNAHIQFAEFKSFIQIMTDILNKTQTMDVLSRYSEYTNILNLFEFYIENNVIPYKILIESLEVLNDFDWSRFTFKERIDYQASIQRIQLILNECVMDSKFIDSTSNEPAFITFKCKTDDFDEAYALVSKYLNSILENLGVEQECFKLVDKKKGSWYLTFMTMASCALVSLKVIKECTNVKIHWIESKERELLSKQRFKHYENSPNTYNSLTMNTMLTKTALLKIDSAEELLPKELIDSVENGFESIYFQSK